MVDTYIKTLKLIYIRVHILLFATFVDFELLVKDIVIKEVSKSSKGSNVKFCSIGSCHNATCAFISSTTHYFELFEIDTCRYML